MEKPLNEHWVSGWIGWIKERGLAERTAKEYQAELKTYLAWCASVPQAPETATPMQIRAYSRSRAEHRGAAAQCRTLCALRSWYRYLVQEGFLMTSPAQLVPSPRLPRRLPVFLEEAEEKTAWEAIDTLNNGVAVHGWRQAATAALLLGCGLRNREVRTLRLDQIQCDEEHIPQRVRVIGKGNKERQLPIAEAARLPVARWYLHRLNLRNYDYARRWSQPAAQIHSPLMFPALDGDAMHAISVVQCVTAVTQTAKITRHITPHKLRHTYATSLHRSGAPITVVQRALGHTSIATTQIYTHVADRELERWIWGEDKNKPTTSEAEKVAEPTADQLPPC